jgi:peptide/nickel transport system substrate-binding protein
LNSLTVGILPEHIWFTYSQGTIGNFKLAENNLKPIGTGPWKFDKFIKKDDGSIQVYFLSRNENYYGQKPYFKTLSFEFFEDCNQAVQEVQNEKIRAMSFVTCKSKNELEKKHVSLYDLTLPQYTALFFNSDTQTDLKDKNFRLALTQSIRKEDIVSQALQGAGSIINAPLLEGQLGYHKDIKKIPFNIDDANILLDKKWTRIQPEDYFALRKTALQKQFQDTLKASSSSTPNTTTLPDGLDTTISETIRSEMPPTQTFYRKDKNNKPLQLTITTVEIPEYQKTADILKQQWQALGIQTNISIIRKTDIKKEILRNHNYEILLYGEIVGADSDLFPFWHSSQVDSPGLNLALFSNRNADKILEEARVTIDDQKRATLYKQFQDILVEELPAIFLYTPTYTFMVNKDIKGITISHLVNPSDRFNYLPDWYEKTTWKWR